VKNMIVATGRCGSTLLSTCLSAHPDVLMLSEFMAAMDASTCFREGDVTAEQWVRILTGDVGIPYLWLSRGITTVEVMGEIERHDIMRPWMRVPGLVLGPLYYFSDEPQALFEEMIAWAKKRPTQPVQKHYAELFAFLEGRTGKTHWIERTAGSTDWIPERLRCFPDARILHIHRDGPETALSMFHHVHFKLSLSLIEDPPNREELRTMVACSAPLEEDPVLKRIGNPPPIEAFGRHWSETIARLYSYIQMIPPERFMDVRSEDLVADPANVLAKIQKFFELPENEDWLREASAMVKPVPTRADKLPEEERKKLEAACQVGRILLKRDTGGNRERLLNVNRALREIHDEHIQANA
jgi:hypothetical protein